MGSLPPAAVGREAQREGRRCAPEGRPRKPPVGHRVEALISGGILDPRPRLGPFIGAPSKDPEIVVEGGVQNFGIRGP